MRRSSRQRKDNGDEPSSEEMLGMDVDLGPVSSEESHTGPSNKAKDHPGPSQDPGDDAGEGGF